MKAIKKFYNEVIGLDTLGEFQNHHNYDGLFLGFPDSNWHLEFTTSNDLPDNKFDGDDLLVFYVTSEIELMKIKEDLKKKNINLEIPKNPYWKQNGIMISDPDNFKILFSMQHFNFNSDDDLTNLVRSKAINNWNDIIEFTRDIPYGRNLNRKDFSLVLKENRGTCSSKHSFLKKLAELNKLDNVKLMIGMYKMNHLNTPKIEATLLDKKLEYIPEAHCYLKINNTRIDVTHRNADIEHLMNDIIEEIEIKPEDVDTFKVDYHKNFLKKWINEEGIKLSFDEIWEIREKCIQKLHE